jgi:hypothetical protein
MLIDPEIIRALKSKARALVDELEAGQQAVDPRDVAQRALISHAPMGTLSVPERAALTDELERYVRHLRTSDTLC